MRFKALEILFKPIIERFLARNLAHSNEHLWPKVVI